MNACDSLKARMSRELSGMGCGLTIGLAMPVAGSDGVGDEIGGVIAIDGERAVVGIELEMAARAAATGGVVFVELLLVSETADGGGGERVQGLRSKVQSCIRGRILGFRFWILDWN